MAVARGETIAGSAHTAWSQEPGEEWWRRAACAYEDPELFFPVGAASARTLQQEREAKAVCARCPVVRACRDWAMATEQTHGIWGGTGERERALALRDERRHQAR
ncbi:WhiB family transcriptional regulator [Streptomyces buecherae]|uniref:WhiB family transcriptional regulator n=1 Tax=Streptomyces buecherae TaxID=2763006 RepID=UPI00164DCC42|nr:WhiB family transcriptional regulator [Streptomyces buecherae]MBC3987281.1 WhiB family transcriptional regulator [Streptomyces buecherae]MBC3990361.1 WhiB family transcriptional regulator [Streptomyces buecherae]QNJ38641.1 WhiB family transcriptional regulator [Streptomyces buecherae]